jgi:gentisate 1,2-dioxygenase
MGETKVPQAVMDADRAALKELMAGQSLLPLWEIYQRVVTDEPSMDVASHHWRWADLSPAVDLSVKTVQGRDADHRVLVLKNPNLPGGVATTNNILAAVQCVLPGERTNPHRHTPAAVRLVLSGQGGGTFVDGVRCEMRTGDFIVTPNWTWHCHHNDSAVPVTWLDILDVPFVKSANAIFGEFNPVEPYPQTLATLPDALFEKGGLQPMVNCPGVSHTPRLRYAWTDVCALLEAMQPAEDGSRAVRYTNPLDGGPVIATMDASVLELPAGRPSCRARSTASRLVAVIEGAGHSRVGGLTHHWGPHDVFTIPEWNWVEHQASSARARLLVVSDEPFRRRSGLLREERA